MHADVLGAARDALRLCEDDGHIGEYESGSYGWSGAELAKLTVDGLEVIEARS